MKKLKITLILLFCLIFCHPGRIFSQEKKNDICSTPNIKWQIETGAPVYGSIVYEKDLLYAGNQSGKLFAIEPDKGDVQWTYQTEGAINCTPVVKEGVLYFASMDGHVYALSAQNGSLNWKFSTGGEKQKDIWDYTLSSPVLKGDTLFYGSSDGNLYALDRHTGKKLWQFSTDGMIHTTPVIKGKQIFFGNFNGYFFALNMETMNLNWKFNTIGQQYFPKGAVQQGAAIAGETLFFGSRDFNIYALNAQTGTGVWNMYEQGSWVISTPVIKDTLLLFGTSDSYHFYALDLRNGRKKWRTDVDLNILSKATAGDKLVYVGSLAGKLYAMNLSDGSIEWTFQTQQSKENWHHVFNKNNEIRKDIYKINDMDIHKVYDQIHNLGSIISQPTLNEGVLYLGSMDGMIYAIE